MEELKFVVQVQQGVLGREIETNYERFKSCVMTTFKSHTGSIGLAISSISSNEAFSVLERCLNMIIQRDRTLCMSSLYTRTYETYVLVYNEDPNPIPTMVSWQKDPHWQTTNEEIWNISSLTDLLKDCKNSKKLYKHLDDIVLLEKLPEFTNDNF